MNLSELQLIMEIQDKEQKDNSGGIINQELPKPESELNLSTDLPVEEINQEEPILLEQKIDVLVITIVNDENIAKTVSQLDSVLKKKKLTGVIYMVSDILQPEEIKNAIKNNQGLNSKFNTDSNNTQSVDKDISNNKTIPSQQADFEEQNGDTGTENSASAENDEIGSPE